MNLTVRWRRQILTNLEIKLGPAMTDPLSIYLSDHLAGAKFAIELLEDMRDGHQSDSLTNFAAKMLTEVAADRAVLQELCSEVGDGESVLKKAGAWLAERAAQLK